MIVVSTKIEFNGWGKPSVLCQQYTHAPRCARIVSEECQGAELRVQDLTGLLTLLSLQWIFCAANICTWTSPSVQLYSWPGSANKDVKLSGSGSLGAFWWLLCIILHKFNGKINLCVSVSDVPRDSPEGASLFIYLLEFSPLSLVVMSFNTICH